MRSPDRSVRLSKIRRRRGPRPITIHLSAESKSAGFPVIAEANRLIILRLGDQMLDPDPSAHSRSPAGPTVGRGCEEPWAQVLLWEGGRIAGEVECPERLGGILRYYRRKAA